MGTEKKENIVNMAEAKAKDKTITFRELEDNQAGFSALNDKKEDIDDWELVKDLVEIELLYKDWEKLAKGQQRAIDKKYNKLMEVKNIVIAQGSPPVETERLSIEHREMRNEELEKLRDQVLPWPVKPFNIDKLKNLKLSKRELADLVKIGIVFLRNT